MPGLIGPARFYLCMALIDLSALKWSHMAFHWALIAATYTPKPEIPKVCIQLASPKSTRADTGQF